MNLALSLCLALSHPVHCEVWQPVIPRQTRFETATKFATLSPSTWVVVRPNGTIWRCTCK